VNKETAMSTSTRDTYRENWPRIGGVLGMVIGRDFMHESGKQ
jgi:Leu/Phe-tRNA-protein transferase